MTEKINRQENSRPILNELQLTETEIKALGRCFDLVSDSKNAVDFVADPGNLAFTPAAALAIGVANLTFNLYTEYGKSLADRSRIEYRMKLFAEQLVEIEGLQNGAASVDTLKRLRNELRDL